MARVMGIVNVTPDSFSDGGRYFAPEEAVRRVVKMRDEGADMIDIGGESTRPDATPIPWQEEWARVGPVLCGLKGVRRLPRLSIDTYHVETAERALDLGVTLVNCVSAAAIPDMLRLLDRHGVELVVPCRMSDIRRERKGASLAWRRFADRVYLDPMIGFDTTREEDLGLLGSIGDLAREGRVMVGVSRKRIVRKLTGEKVLGKNLGGNLALAVWCAMKGASVLRVHDVAETVQSMRTLANLPDLQTPQINV